jgi:signal transduction histidine kinase
MKDFATIVALSFAACVLAGLLGAAVMHLLRRRSLRYQLITAALLPVAAVIATVLINVWLMFLSPHDSSVILIALATAVLLAVLGAWLVMRQVARGSAELGAAVERLVEDSTSLGSPVVSHGGTVTQIPEELASVVADLDATRRTLAETRSRQLAAEDARRELVSFMSHDLRTPLAGLRALLEGLEDGVITDVPGAFGHMRATVERMSHLVDDLFELSRVHGSRSPKPEKPVSLSELIMDVSMESAAVARAHNVTLDAQVPSEDRLAVVGSSDDLARVVGNLVANAVRHTGSGQTVRLIGSRAEDGHVRVEVVDGCGGIPEESLGRVFDVGWRGDASRSADDGAGLGLAIARGVVESHDGRIEVRNVSGGCRFAVELPEPGRQDAPA